MIVTAQDSLKTWRVFGYSRALGVACGRAQAVKQIKLALLPDSLLTCGVTLEQTISGHVTYFWAAFIRRGSESFPYSVMAKIK